MRAAFVIALLLLALAAPATDAQAPVPCPVTTTQIKVSAAGLSPPTTNVFVGATVRWTVRDLGEPPHTVTSDAGQAETFDSGPLVFPPYPPLTNSFEFKFQKPGIIKYRCKVHDAMRGQIIVHDAPLPGADFILRIPGQAGFAANERLFDPSVVILDINQTLLFVNPSYSSHSVQFEKPLFPRPRNLGANNEISVDFNETGLYRFRCTQHSTGYETGMVGRVTVVGERPNETVSALSPPPASGESPGPPVPLLIIGLLALALVPRRRA